MQNGQEPYAEATHVSSYRKTADFEPTYPTVEAFDGNEKHGVGGVLPEAPKLQRKLKARHLQMIAIGMTTALNSSSPISLYQF